MSGSSFGAGRAEAEGAGLTRRSAWRRICVPQFHRLFWDGPLPPQGQGAWERGEVGEGLGEVLGFPSPDFHGL